MKLQILISLTSILLLSACNKESDFYESTRSAIQEKQVVSSPGSENASEESAPGAGESPVVMGEELPDSDEDSAPVVSAPPLPSSDEAPAPVVSAPPLPSSDEAPAPIVIAQPLPSSDEAPAPIVIAQPLPSSDEAPAPIVIAQPLPSTNEAPAPVVVAQPLPSTNEAPAPAMPSNPWLALFPGLGATSEFGSSLGAGSSSESGSASVEGEGDNCAGMAREHDAILGKACRYTFCATDIQEDAKITIISGPKEKLSNLNHEEFLKLSPDAQAFLSSAVQNNLPGVKVVGSKFQTIQDKREKLIIRNSVEAAAIFNQIRPDAVLDYLIQGNIASFQATGLNENGRVHAVLDSKDSALVQFTTIEKNAEVFVLFLTEGENVTCVRTTGSNGRIASYVYGEDGFATQGHMRGTGYSHGTQLINQVIGGDNTLATFNGGGIVGADIRLTTIGGVNTNLRVRSTNLEKNNLFDIFLKGEDTTNMIFSATSAGIDNIVNLDIEGNKNTSASFQFTSEGNLKINGRMLSEAPVLDLVGRLKSSTTAKVNVSLEKK